MRRHNHYFGVHFDFHALPGQTVAYPYRPDIIAKMLDEVKPDFVQCDTKGHQGIYSYPTKVGVPAEDMRADMLATWRKLTAERGIAMYAHHSGLYDIAAVTNHPDWAVIKADGTLDTDHVSPFSPFVTEYLIPSIYEIIDYGFDGIWVDGECWGLRVDYSHWAVDAYKKETGKEPARVGEEGYAEYAEFCREVFRRYVTTYVEAAHKKNPDFAVTSNWIYSAYMPEGMTVPVDYLSGDYSTSNSVNSARHSARIFAARGITWDLMAWGQHAIPCSWKTVNRNTKESAQLCQEGAQVLALGGAFQFFNIMYGGGGLVQEWAIPSWKKVAEFCRERKDVCYKSEEVPEIAVLYPNENSTLTGECPYSPGDTFGGRGFVGWTHAVQDIGFSGSTVFESTCTKENLDRYSTVIVPAARVLARETVEAIRDYAARGGKVLVEGGSAHFFMDAGVDFGARVTGAEEERLRFMDGGEALTPMNTYWYDLDVTDGREVLVSYIINYYDGAPMTAAVAKNYGKGQILLCGADFGRAYRQNVSTASRSFARRMLVDGLGFAPVAEVSGSTLVDVVTRRKNGSLMVNLMNVGGNHNVQGVRSFSEIPPIGPITVSVRADQCPKVTLHPEKREMAVDYRDGIATVTLDRLEIHSILEFAGI